MALSGTDKETQLQELSSIVSGIRLFNRDCGKGGEGIDDCKLSKEHTCCRHTYKQIKARQYVHVRVYVAVGSYSVHTVYCSVGYNFSGGIYELS